MRGESVARVICHTFKRRRLCQGGTKVGHRQVTSRAVLCFLPGALRCLGLQTVLDGCKLTKLQLPG